MNRTDRKALRDAAAPLVADIFMALVHAGMTACEAGATIRHATYVLEGQAAKAQEGQHD